MAAETRVTGMARAAFAELASLNLPLTDVRGRYFLHEGPPIWDAVELYFGNQSVLVTALEDDSLAVTPNQTIPDTDHHFVQSLNETPPWKDAIDRPLLWAWVMVNQQGYFDGLQLDFCELPNSAVVRIQLLAIGSELQLQ